MLCQMTTLPLLPPPIPWTQAPAEDGQPPTQPPGPPTPEEEVRVTAFLFCVPTTVSQRD